MLSWKNLKQKTSFPFLIVFTAFLLFSIQNLKQGKASELEFALDNITGSKKAEISLRALETTVKAGEVLHLAFIVKPLKNWHVYFENPGVGFPFSPNWDLPQDAVGSKIFFPTPKVMMAAGSVSYVYENEVIFLAEVSVPEGEGSFTVKSHASYLICDDKICVPEEAELEVTLNYGKGEASAENIQFFEQARSHFAKITDWKAIFSAQSKKAVRVEIDLPKEYQNLKNAFLYPRTFDLMEYRLDEKTIAADGKLFIELEAMEGVDKIDRFDFIIELTLKNGRQESFDIKAFKSPTVLSSKFLSPSDGLDFFTNIEQLSLWKALLFAFIGGLILNLMPCVFPILSLKALSLAEIAKKSPAQARMNGNFYTLGVLTCFSVIAFMMLALRWTGNAVGWGFHMQMPVVNLILGLLMVAIALNLFGLFEFGRSWNVGGRLLKGGKYKESFFTGLLAVIVATPCTAPFMASALGYSSVAPVFNSFLVFLFLGLGLAFPYLLLSYHSGFRKILPRSGSWMFSMRQILSFPMFLTALWLFWILGRQIGADGMALAILSAIMMSFALFSVVRKGASWKGAGAVSFIMMSYFIYAVYSFKATAAAVDKVDAILGAENFTPTKMIKYVKEGRSLFIYFTADWCVTCKINEQGVLRSNELSSLFEKNKVIVLKGDMTTHNPEIVNALKKFGRIGVPLYVFYGQEGVLNKPIILPQLLSYRIMEDLFKE